MELLSLHRENNPFKNFKLPFLNAQLPHIVLAYFSTMAGAEEAIINY